MNPPSSAKVRVSYLDQILILAREVTRFDRSSGVNHRLQLEALRGEIESYDRWYRKAHGEDDPNKANEPIQAAINDIVGRIA